MTGLNTIKVPLNRSYRLAYETQDEISDFVSQFNWNPFARRARLFRSHTMTTTNDKIEIKPTKVLLLSKIFVVFWALFISGFGVWVAMKTGDKTGITFFIVTGLAFSIITWVAIGPQDPKTFLDKSNHIFTNRELQGPLSDIMGLQIVDSVRHRNTKYSTRRFTYVCLELCLLLNNRERALVAASSNHDSVKQMAAEISSFLEVPVFEGIRRKG